jgi:hypothetical protein
MSKLWKWAFGICEYGANFRWRAGHLDDSMQEVQVGKSADFQQIVFDG